MKESWCFPRAKVDKSLNIEPFLCGILDRPSLRVSWYPTFAGSIISIGICVENSTDSSMVCIDMWLGKGPETEDYLLNYK